MLTIYDDEFSNLLQRMIYFLLTPRNTVYRNLNVLKNCKEFLNDGAIVLVDDVKDNNHWDGSYEAFFEFVREQNLKYEIIGSKCGKFIWNKLK